MYFPISNFSEFKIIAENEQAALFYFSHEDCNVCKVLKPKIEELIETFFPKIKLYFIDTKLYPEVAAQNSIFVNPTILIYFDKNEFIRKSRNFGIEELKLQIERLYNLVFF